MFLLLLVLQPYNLFFQLIPFLPLFQLHLFTNPIQLLLILLQYSLLFFPELFFLLLFDLFDICLSLVFSIINHLLLPFVFIILI